MKQLFIAILIALALTASAYSTDTNFSQQLIQQLPFQPTNIGADRTYTVSVTNGSATVLTAVALPSDIVGKTGFTVSISGTLYAVASIPSTGTLTLTTNYSGSTGSATLVLYKFVYLRIHADQTFRPASSSQIVQQSSPGSGLFYAEYAVSIRNVGSGNVAYIQPFTIPATVDSDRPSGTYQFIFYGPTGNKLANYKCQNDKTQLRVPSTVNSFADLCTYNSGSVPPVPDQYYTIPQINTFLPSCTANQLIYAASSGRAYSCLTVGTGLSISSATLNATAAATLDTHTYIYAADPTYGAVCDGATDDTAAINNAIGAAITAKKRVILPGGTCRVTQILLSDYAQIQGAGVGKTILDSITNQAIVAVTGTAFHGQISDLTIRGRIIAGAAQVGLDLEGSGFYWQFLAERLRIEDTGGAGYKNTKAFSSTFKDIFIDNTAGFAVDYDANSPANRHVNLYVGGIRSTAPVAFRIRGGEFYCENCNGINGCPASGVCTWARIGKKSGTDGDVTNGFAEAIWTHSNAESWKTIAFEHLYGSRSTFKDGTTIVGDLSATGKKGITYEAIVGQFPQYAVKAYIDDTVKMGDPLTQYANSELIHSDQLPPLMVHGQGISAGGTAAGQKVNTYRNTTTSQSEKLVRADGFVQRQTVTVSTVFVNPGIRYIEANCPATCTITIPWAGWYWQTQEPITIKDISGGAAANPVVVVSGGGGSINGTSNYDIRRNNGSITVMPYESDLLTGVDWRVISDFGGEPPVTISAPGSANTGFFTTYANTAGRLNVGSALFQSGSDIAINGGRLIFVQGANTLTIAPHASTGSYTWRFPSGAPASTQCLQIDSSGQVSVTGSACGSGGGSGITSIAASTGGAQTGPAISLLPASTGTDFTITGSANTITVAIPTASALARGLVSAADFSMFNAKIAGTIATSQIAVGASANTIGGSSALTAGGGSVLSTGSANSAVGFSQTNSSSGTVAQSLYALTNNASDQASFGLTSSGFTTSGLFSSHQAYLNADTGITSLLFRLNDSGTTSFKFGVSTSQVARIDETGLSIGTIAPSTKIDVASTGLAAGFAGVRFRNISNATAPDTGITAGYLGVDASGYVKVITTPGGLPDPGANGILARTALNTLSARTITGTANEITVADGNGVSANPTLSIASTFDISGKTSTKPMKSGTVGSIPGTCGVGEYYFATDAAAGSNTYACTAVNTWTVQAVAGSAGALSALTAAVGGNSINNGDNAQVWNWALTTSGKTGFAFAENTAGTSAGTPHLVSISTRSTSTINPLQVVINSNTTPAGIRVNTSGLVVAVGTGGVDGSAIVTANSVANSVLDADLAALGNNSTDGLLTHTGAGTVSARTLTAGSASLTVSNGNGVSGNPTVDTVQNIQTTATPQFAALGLGVAAPSAGLLVTGKTISTDATNTVGAASLAFSVTKNDTNTRVFYGEKITATLNTGGSNANTTVNLLAVDTTNTAVTGLTTNLLSLNYGGASKLLVDSGGNATFGGAITVTGCTGCGNAIVSPATTAYSVVTTDALVVADATSAAFTVTYFTAVGNNNKVVTTCKVDTSSNNVSVSATSTYTLSAPGQCVTLASNNTSWYLVY